MGNGWSGPAGPSGLSAYQREGSTRATFEESHRRIAAVDRRGRVRRLCGHDGDGDRSCSERDQGDPQPDGKVIKVRLWGDEYIHGWETLSGYTVVQGKADKTWKYARQNAAGRLVATDRVVGKDAPQGKKHVRPSTAAYNAVRKAEGAPAIGEYAAAPPAWSGSDTDVLFLYVEFSDLGCTFTPAQMQANMFGATASGPGNLADYYDEISYGALQLDGDVIGNAATTIASLCRTPTTSTTGRVVARTRW